MKLNPYDVYYAAFIKVARGIAWKVICPVIVLFSEASNKCDDTVVVIPLSTDQPETNNLTNNIQLERSAFTSPVFAMCDEVCTIEKSCVNQHICSIDSEVDREHLAIAVQIEIGLVS